MSEPNQAPDEDLCPEPYPLTPAERAAILAKAKGEFTAADLQLYTEEEEGIPFEEVLREVKEMIKKAKLRKS